MASRIRHGRGTLVNVPRLSNQGNGMAHLRIEHVFNCSEDTFWNEVFFAQDYNERLYKTELRFPVWKETERRETDAEIQRVVEVVPRVGDLPMPLKKLIGEGIGYAEHGRFDKRTRRYYLNVKPNQLADKVTISGEMFTEPAGDGKCKRVFEANVSAKIFGIGGMLEKRLLDDMTKSYDVSALFTNRYLAEKSR